MCPKRNAVGLQSCEESPARAPSGLLQIVFRGGDVRACAKKRETEARGESRHETFVFIGFGSAKLVIQVGDGERDVEGRGQFQQRMQQANGIRTAGYRDGHAAPARQHVITSNGFADPLQHGQLFHYCSV